MLSVIKTIDTSNQTVAEYQYSRNANGALTNIAETNRLKDGTVSEKNTAYTYDSVSRLIREEISNAKGSIQFIYGYDAEGVRVWKETEDVRTTYITDRFDTYTQVLLEQKSSGETDYYTRGNRLVCRTANDDSKVFYLYDGHGNVTVLTDNLGNVTDNYSYTAYGVLLTKDGETENEYLYCGEQMDATTGLYYLRARYFNPLTATFTQKDSYEGNLYSPVTQNGYLYTGGNPVMYTDPSGNEATLSEMATVIGIMGIVSSVVVVNYQHYIAPYLAMRAQMCWDNLVSTAGALRNAFEAAKRSLSDDWEILVVPERITNTIVDGIPVRVREVAIEIFPSIVQEGWKEVFPAHIEEDNRIILGPQVIDREVWDNIYYTENQTAQEIIIKEKKGAINQEFPKEWLNKTDVSSNQGKDIFRKAYFKKGDIKMVNDAANQVGVNRKEFGNYIHEIKKDLGMKANQNFTYQELIELAEEFANMMK